MKKTLVSLILILVIIMSAFSLASCSGETLYLFNYGDYISPEVYDLFYEETGIKVVYDEYAAPEDMYAKFTSGTAKYDLICTSDYMLEKLIKEELVQEIDFNNVQNIKNIDQNQLEASKAFDSEGKFTVPHFWGDRKSVV